MRSRDELLSYITCDRMKMSQLSLSCAKVVILKQRISQRFKQVGNGFLSAECTECRIIRDSPGEELDRGVQVPRERNHSMRRVPTD